MKAIGLTSGIVLALLLSSQEAWAQQRKYTLEAEFDQGTLVNTLHEQATCPTCFPDRNLVILGRTFVSQAGAVWVDNNPEGWIVGLDSKTGKQLVRLDSGLERINGLLTGSAPSRTKCGFWIGSNYSAAGNLGNCPGRITTDANGDVWIVNRGFNIQGTLSKFTTTKSHCIDRNNNGKIDSSADLDGNGIVDPDTVDPVTGEREYLGADEECILATVPIGGINELPRAVAVDKKGKIWVATFSGRRVYRFDPNEPLTLEATIDLRTNPATNRSPYSAATGKDYLFLSAKPSTILRISIDPPYTVQAAACAGDTYGIVANPDGTEAWAGAHGNNGVQHATFPATGNGTCETWPSNNRSITAVTLDTTPASQGGPFVWGTAYNNGGFILKYNLAGQIVGEYADGSATHGISVDFQNRLWVVSHQAPFIRVHQTDGTLATAGNLPAFGFDMLPTTTAANAGYNYDPYLYSDYTGVQLDRQAPFTRVGTWSGITDGGAAGIPWKRVLWNEEAIGTQAGAEPEGTALTLSARAAESNAALATAAFVTVPNGKDGGPDLTGLVGRFIEVRADLTGPGYETPVLSDVTVVGPCPNGGGETCCLSAADCNDGVVCTLDACPSPGAACTHTPKPSCCTTDSECADTNLCTTDACDTVNNLCTHVAIPDCCSSSEDCEDGDLCTADLCSGPGGKCGFKAIQGCCLVDADCTKGNLCSNASCPAPGALCKPSTQTGCCTSDSDCKDSDACTADKCDVVTKACSNDFIAGCCTADAQCNDNDPCTVDKCTGNVCSHDAKDGANCCTQSSPSIGESCDIPKAPNNFPPCKAGKKVCKPDGAFGCEGAVLPADEVCDGVDNDCDGVVDDAAKGCEMGFSCVKAQCVQPCKGGEFPCSPGFNCVAGFCFSGSAGGAGGAGGKAGAAGAAGATGGSAGAATGGAAGATTAGSGGSAGGAIAGAAGATTAGAAGTSAGASAGGKAGASGTTGGGAGGRAGSSAAGRGGAAGTLGAEDDPDRTFGLATGGGLRCAASPGETGDPRHVLLALVGLCVAASRRVRSAGRGGR